MGKLQIKYMGIEKLIPYTNNPRRNETAIDAVARSIEEFGFKNPIIIDTNNEIIAGHTRLLAAKKLGLTEVPTILADDLTPAQVKAFRIADNRTAEFAEWDMELLDKELEELYQMDFDLDLIGFNLEDFKIEEPTEVEEDDYEGEPPENPISKRGDIWQLDKHRLMCGDSTNKEDVYKLMDGNKADLTLTDPPYGINVVGNDGKVGAEFGIAKKGVYSKIISDDTTETAKLAYDIIKEVSERQIIWGGNYFIDFLPFSTGWVIWDKRCNSGIRNTFADGEMAWCSFKTPVRIYHQLWNGMIREGEKDKRVHPTQKPIRMLSEILVDFSKDNDIILDLFGGSGSTLIACEQLGRTCYMMELDPTYIDVIIDRWEKFTGLKAELISRD